MITYYFSTLGSLFHWGIPPVNYGPEGDELRKQVALGHYTLPWLPHPQEELQTKISSWHKPTHTHIYIYTVYIYICIYIHRFAVSFARDIRVDYWLLKPCIFKPTCIVNPDLNIPISLHTCNFCYTKNPKLSVGRLVSPENSSRYCSW